MTLAVLALASTLVLLVVLPVSAWMMASAKLEEGQLRLALAAIVGSGFAMLLAVGFAQAPLAWHAMAGVGLVMAAIFASIWFGCETKGLPDELLAAHADTACGIPIQTQHVRSLNLSSAVAVVVYEALRQIDARG